MKRILILLLCVFLLAGLTACGAGSSEDTQASTESTEPPVSSAPQYPENDSVGLEYEINEDGESCTITGIGTCEDTAIVIGSYIDGYEVTAIGDYAFFQCTELIGISMSDSITSIGAFSFYGCNALMEVLFGDHLVTISRYAFAYCSNLTQLVLPESVEQIGQWAFYYCPSLSGVYISDLSSWLRIQFESIYSNPLRYAGNLYLNDELVTELIFPEDMTVVSDWVFEGCVSLERIVLHEGITEIGERAFRDCENLTRVEYAGTREQWHNIAKDSNWNASMNDYAIVCSDGQIKG